MTMARARRFMIHFTRQIWLRILCCLLAYLGWISPLQAEGYQLVSGDVLSISHSGTDVPIEATVDLNGHIRLVDFGPIAVRGLELDQAVDAIKQVIEAADLFLDPRVDIAIVEHAAVVAGGDVTNPGRLAFQPGMTVETLIASAGGLQRQGRFEAEVLHLRTDLQAQLEQQRLEVETQKMRILRINAALAGAGTINLSTDSIEIEADGAGKYEMLRLLEQRILEADNDRVRRLVGNWEREIDTIELQQSIYSDRLKVRTEIAAVAKTELDIAKDLQSKGLQTSARMVTVELREANARSDVLELQSAQVAAATLLTQAQLEKDSFISQRRKNLMAELQLSEKNLDLAKIDLNRIRTQLRLLKAPVRNSALEGDLFELSIQIRSGRSVAQTPKLDAMVHPGDTVIVRVLPIRLAKE